MPFSSDVLDLDISDHVATLWLARPEKRNALGQALWRDLPQAAETISQDGSVRCVVLAARGPHFTVGLDLSEFGTMTGDGKPTSPAVASRASYRSVRRLQDAVTALERLPMPVIAAVHGYCIGGGVDIITACDIRLASSDAIFSVREAKIAIVADLGTLQRLPRIVGAGHVAELAYTGKDIPAARAAAIGLVNDVVEGSAADVLAAAHALAGEIAANSPLAVQGTKEVLRANDGATIDEGLDFVARYNAAFLRSRDLTEAITAFFEKRPPQFTGE